MVDHSIDNYSNWYLNGAQGAYTGRYDNLSFPNLISKGKYLIDYSKPDANGKNPDYTQTLANTGKKIYAGKDANGNPIEISSDGKLYLQPDNNLMSNEETGFNAYVVTNTPTITTDTRVMFAIRGSDGFGNLGKIDEINGYNIRTDWTANDFEFTLNASEIPQVNYAKAALQDQIDKLPAGVSIDVTGHSLGTIVSIETIAKLEPGYVDRIGNVVLFDAPDARAAVNSMGKQAKANIAALEQAGKLHFYVNAFDFVSMLNRNTGNEIGNVHYIIPKDYNNTLENPSGHDTYEMSYKMDEYGNPRVANQKDNPDIFAYGDMVSTFERKAISSIQSLIPGSNDRSTALRLVGFIASNPEIMKKLTDSEVPLTDKYSYLVSMMLYQGIDVDVAWAAKHLPDIYALKKQFDNLTNMYPPKISKLQSQIRNATGSEKISLRAELVQETADAARAAGQAYSGQVKDLLILN
jgi:hypothetical protein